MYGPLKDNLGMRRIRPAYTAEEAIGPETFVFFLSLGINVAHRQIPDIGSAS
ncbi:MAG: hypothetical protein Q7W02_01330 [Candidatus Rokubacteria bacterium]|nr:hypothetical protein [Candidatus Rokubacteria bacterium]